MAGKVTDYGSNFPTNFGGWAGFIKRANEAGIYSDKRDELRTFAQTDLEGRIDEIVARTRGQVSDNTKQSLRDTDFVGIVLKEKDGWEMWMDFILNKSELYQRYLTESAKLRPILAREGKLMQALYTTHGVELAGSVPDLSAEERQQRDESSERCKEMWKEIVDAYGGTDREGNWKTLLHKLEA